MKKKLIIPVTTHTECHICKLTTFYYCIVDVLPVYKKRKDQEQIPGEHLLLKGLEGLCYCS